MTDIETDKKKKLPVILAVSLALNAALIGLMGGQMLVGDNKYKSPHSSRDGQHRPPIEHVLNVLNESERKTLKKTMIQHWKNSHAEREAMREKHDKVIAVISLDPFEREAVEAALSEFEQADQRMKNIAASGVLDVMQGLSADARVALAETLLLQNRKSIRRPPPRMPCKEGEKCEKRGRGDRPERPSHYDRETSRPKE
ncbi:periplasmic heavy metal sensor [Hirschia litorea]|uniref:Periplasmic heavy metal sensor n=1 Tax=Hirschia litorea TaxID=1199156 RepID=A0ABW2IID8_9PROT